ncbi:hypothetical protein L596_013189 [Steinernema carpocapsae]|uniref:Uncharacterized protein n=1 Tax=Steinernema carpocapsae TaxID=34508 RepID=A0A4U5NZG0_STECR|nr:hypothetical protein L596_013189 [Steinernema carpocapsae]
MRVQACTLPDQPPLDLFLAFKNKKSCMNLCKLKMGLKLCDKLDIQESGDFDLDEDCDNPNNSTTSLSSTTTTTPRTTTHRTGLPQDSHSSQPHFNLPENPPLSIRFIVTDPRSHIQALFSRILQPNTCKTSVTWTLPTPWLTCLAECQPTSPTSPQCSKPPFANSKNSQA